MIYKITNKLNGQSYVGKTTKSIEERFERHIYNSKVQQTHLARAIRKYGKENFVVEEIENSFREEHWIDKLKPEYNMTAGGDGGATHHLDSFKESMKKYHANKPKSEYATYGFLGKKMPEDAKQQISEANTKAWASYSEEERKARGATVKGEKNGMFGRAPANATPITFRGISYKSINEAKRETGVSIYYIMKEVKNERKERRLPVGGILQTADHR